MKRRTVFLTLIVLSIFVLFAGAALAGDESPTDEDPCEPYGVNFMQFTHNGFDPSTHLYSTVWEYEAWTSSDAPHAMSHWNVEAGRCYNVVACWPEPCEVGVDPHTDIFGVKWEWGPNPGETLQGGFITESYQPPQDGGLIETGMKASELVCTYEANGPGCTPNGEPIGDSPPRGGFQPPISIDPDAIPDIGPPVKKFAGNMSGDVLPPDYHKLLHRFQFNLTDRNGDPTRGFVGLKCAGSNSVLKMLSNTEGKMVFYWWLPYNHEGGCRGVALGGGRPQSVDTSSNFELEHDFYFTLRRSIPR